MRLTTSGTFLHGNYWADAEVFGEENVSHGCVGLRDVKGGSADTPAGWFFDRTLIGDVVEVVNSKDRKVAPDNGLGGWNMGWKEWKAGCRAALSPATGSHRTPPRACARAGPTWGGSANLGRNGDIPEGIHHAHGVIILR